MTEVLCRFTYVFRRPGRGILRGRVAHPMIVTKVRLLRFGSERLFPIGQFFLLDAIKDVRCEQLLIKDLIEILTVVSSRLYGSRGRTSLRALAA
ncbi:hypothetical protein SB861_49120 [Paraburkholderia sp. SIMBA_049]